MERPIFIRNKDPLREGSTLVVGINKKGNITRFNETLEQLTGSSKKDVLDESFSSYFSKQIPNEELQKLINEARFNPDGVDVDTSFQTVQGENMMISWTGFPIKNDTDGRVSQLNLVGTLQKQSVSAKNKKSQKKKTSDSTKKKSKSKKSSTNKKPSKKPDQTKSKPEQKAASKTESSGKNVKETDKEQKDSKAKKSKKQSKEKNKKTAKTKKTKSKEKKKSSKKKKKKIRIKRNSKKVKSKTKKERFTESPGTIENSDTNIIEKLSKRFSLPRIQKTIIKKKKEKKKPSKTLPKISLPLKKSEKTTNTSSSKKETSDKQTKKSLQKTIKKLEKENKRLQQENEKLDKNLHDAELKKQELKEFFNNKFRFIRDSVGIKKKREEFKNMMQQLSDRKQKLEKLETDMVLEKKEFKQKIEEFITWREKLEKLEQEIEKRRQFLSEQETFLNEQYDKVLSHELTQPATYTQQPKPEEPADLDEKPGILEKDDLFNSLTVEAAVLQRGRIKKANKRFAEMLGYNAEELEGKHLVDFVGPNGLTGVEQHYMNRLKGVDDASYQTVFLSKSEDEIPVKVHVKTGDFQGERAEIATFNEV